MIKKYYVNKPVINIFKTCDIGSKFNRKNPLLETQLLFGEHVCILGEKEEFYYVSIPGQAFFSRENGWGNYCGFALKEDLSFAKSVKPESAQLTEPVANVKCCTNTKLLDCQTLLFGTGLAVIENRRKMSKILFFNGSTGYIDSRNIQKIRINKTKCRETLMLYAKKNLGTPYLWGGRSFYTEKVKFLTGVDCSGLTHLLYRQIGISIPRNAHDQFLVAKMCSFSSLLPGDLIFNSEKGPKGRIDHVMLYKDKDTIIEATGSVGLVRQISGTKRFGKNISSLNTKETVNNMTLYAGKILID